MNSGWGNYPKQEAAEVLHLQWRDENIFFSDNEKSFLCRGQGKSYGDSCLNENGILISTQRLNRFIDFDKENGILECESGITLAEILDLVLPQQWFLAVVPGTELISLGGAIANDIHGKNHHCAGTFGRHVLSFELLQSTGKRMICSPESNPELYQASIGGLGLTGIILSAKLQLKKVHSGMMAVEHIPFKNLQEFFTLNLASEKKYEYTVAWLDCTASARNFGRGIYIRANHQDAMAVKQVHRHNKKIKLNLPFYFPKATLNNFSITAFNHYYFSKQSAKKNLTTIPYQEFFFPLDAIKNWNRIYGKPGFIQFQCVLPDMYADKIADILKIIISSGQASFLSVLKTFGDLKSPGILSFPCKGITLAVDLPFKGVKTLDLMQRLHRITRQYEGRLYPAKDACMDSATFKNSYPQWEIFSKYIDPQFSSSFWRRVMQYAT